MSKPKHKVGDVVTPRTPRKIRTRHCEFTALPGARFRVAAVREIPTPVGVDFVYDLVAEDFAGATKTLRESAIEHAGAPPPEPKKRRKKKRKAKAEPANLFSDVEE